VKWSEIAGLDYAKKTIKEIIIWPLLRPDIFTGIKRPPKGLLLFGPPGTGKTMIAKAIASEAKARFFNISASSLTSKWIGESEKLARSLFALACLYQPSVIFIDEIDSILCKRSENENESSRRLKTEFLVQLDGAGTNQNDAILIIGATNRPQEIDDAVIRRMSKRLYIPLPDYVSRMELIKTVVNKEEQMGSKYYLPEKDLDEIVKICKGYSGSDLMSVVREASMQPIRSIEDFDIENIKVDDLRPVDKCDFIYALQSVKASVQSKTISQYEDWNNEFGSFKFNAIET
jgi:SpoVK/Ycf46/Vps4 family AAA+-type ATPase